MIKLNSFIEKVLLGNLRGKIDSLKKSLNKSYFTAGGIFSTRSMIPLTMG